jgi:hypothetical protein
MVASPQSTEAKPIDIVCESPAATYTFEVRNGRKRHVFPAFANLQKPSVRFIDGSKKTRSQPPARRLGDVERP